MSSKMSQAKVPIPNPRVELEMSHLLEKYSRDHFSRLLAEVEIKPVEQTHISLGNYSRDQIPQGFALKLHPELSSDELVTQITKLEHENGGYELVLHVANYGERTISIEIWQP